METDEDHAKKRESFSLAQKILCCSPKQRQLEQSRRGECYSATWGVRSTLARPQGTHAGQLPANTAIYCDTPCPPRTFTTFILSAIWQENLTTHCILHSCQGFSE